MAHCLARPDIPLYKKGFPMLNDGDKGAILQRDKETYAVAPHMPCGVVTPDQLRKIADVAEKHNAAALKLTSAARIAIVGLAEDQIDAVWADLGMDPGAAVGLCVRSVKACPGTTFCKRGKQDSLGMGMALDAAYHGKVLPGKLKMGVSGCANQCAESSIKDVGLVGGPKGWKIFVGGCAGARPRLGDLLIEGIDTDEGALAAVASIVACYEANAKPKERLGRMIDRLGIEPLQQAVGVV
jgi:NAD(P)H-nitrite reductase large subunit